MARVDRAGVAQFKRQLGSLALVGASGGVQGLQGKLSGGKGGVQYPGQPNRSSAPGEYPAEQTGRLLDSLDAEPWGEGAARFGPINSPPDYVAALHFKPPSDGGRPFLDLALDDPDIHRAVTDALEDAAPRLLGTAVTLRRGT